MRPLYMKIKDTIIRKTSKSFKGVSYKKIKDTMRWSIGRQRLPGVLQDVSYIKIKDTMRWSIGRQRLPGLLKGVSYMKIKDTMKWSMTAKTARSIERCVLTE